jgi:type I restriction enzyme, S subunit
LLCVRGSTGVVSVASDELAGGNVTRGIVPIRFDKTKVTQSFGYYLLISAPVQKQIREKTYGTALMQINIRDVRRLSVLVPKLSDQSRIAARLDNIADEALRLQELYRKKRGELQALKESMLQQAFSGGLTSPPSSAIKEAAE